MTVFWKRLAAAVSVLALLWLSFLASQIVASGRVQPVEPADVAIVLGAAVYHDRPSPVFAERIKHGIDLYRHGKVGRLIFTGGYGTGARYAEAAVARRYAIGAGIPAQAILIETRSRTTRQNLVEAHAIMQTEGLRTALIISDPLHLKRSLRMAAELGISARAAPTPTSRYRSWRSRAGFLFRELVFYHYYLLTGR